MFDPCAWAGNTGVTPLLAFGLRFVSLGFVLDVHTPAFSLEALFTRFVFITFVRPYVTAGIGGVQHLFKRVGVVFLRGADVAFSDQLVVAVGTDAELVTVVAEQGWLYLAVILDLYSRQVIGWSMSERMTADLVCDALQMAIFKRKRPKGVSVHSD